MTEFVNATASGAITDGTFVKNVTTVANAVTCQTAVATEAVFGVARVAVDTTKATEIQTSGNIKLRVDGAVGAIAAGDFIGPEAIDGSTRTGKGIKVTTGVEAYAIALEPATVDGAIINVTLITGGKTLA